jgi:hypothetical protein
MIFGASSGQYDTLCWHNRTLLLLLLLLSQYRCKPLLLLLLLLLLQINGKKLRPARGVFARFMTPLLLWWVLAFIIYGLSLRDLNKLQQPLTSLQVQALIGL